MKKIIFIFLFFNFYCFSQDSIKVSRSIVSVDKMNVVYRGIVNPISIAVADGKSFKASGLGLKEREITGKYTLSPGAGKEMIVKIEAIMQDDSVVIEEKIFRIKNIEGLSAVIDGENCRKCVLEFSRKELKTKQIRLANSDVFFEIDFNNYKIESFWVVFPNEKAIHVEGNFLDKKSLKEIDKLKDGEIIKLTNIKFYSPIKACFAPLNPIKIMIIEDKKD